MDNYQCSLSSEIILDCIVFKTNIIKRSIKWLYWMLRYHNPNKVDIMNVIKVQKVQIIHTETYFTHLYYMYLKNSTVDP